MEDVEVVEQETSGNVRQGVVWDFFFYNAKRPSRRMVFRAIIHDPGSTGSGFGFGACGSFWRISGAKDVESKLQVETNASTSTTHFDVFISFGFI